MNTKLKVGLASLALAAVPVGVGVATTAPAQAAGGCIRHYAPDDGYDNDFIVRWNGFDSWIAEGQEKCGVTMINVASGTKIVCTQNNSTWIVQWDATGWHGVGNNFGGQCVNQLD